MRNFYLTKNPFVGSANAIGIQSSSSQQATYAPASRALDIYSPGQVWRTTSAVTDQWVTIDLQNVSPADVALKALHVGRVNFPECLVYGSPNGDGSTFYNVTPNTLKWNNKPRQAAGSGAPASPWAIQAGALTITPDVIGPGTGLLGQRVSFDSGSALSQSVAYGSNAEVQSKNYVFSIWMRCPTGAATVTLSVTSNGVKQSSNFSVTSFWQRFDLKNTLASNATTPVRVQVEPASGSLLLDVWGAQLCWGTDILTTYETNGNGIVIPYHLDINRRQAYIDLPYFNYRYLRFYIPGGQTTDDGSSYYSTGVIAPLQNIIKIWGGLQVPRPVSVFRGSKRLDLDGGGAEISEYGGGRITVELSGTWRTALQRSDLAGVFAKNKRGTAIHMFENLNYPECPEEIVDISKSYITRLVSDYASSYSLVELYDQSFSFEEIV